MFDIGWSEMGVIALIALIVIGPKDLPKVMRSAAHWARKARGLAREFQSGVDDMIREADLEDARAAVDSAKSLDVRKAITDTVDPTGDIRDEARDVENTARKSGEVNDTDSKDQADTDADTDSSTDGAPEPNIAPPHSLSPPQDGTETKPSPEPVSPAAADDDTGKRAS